MRCRIPNHKEKEYISKQNWQKRWMDMARLVSTWSKDRSTEVGCAIVDSRQVLLSIGWNGFPRKINDDVDSRHERPDKYKWTVHAEENAIYNAASKGIELFGSTMYLPWYPCSRCAGAIIQSGISTLVCIEHRFDDPNWELDFKIAKEMLTEAVIEIIHYED